MSETGLQPREPRESVFLSGLVTRFGQGAPTRHRIRNLSPRGACLDQAEPLRQGQTVLLDVGVLAEVGATVVWVKDGLAGLKFAHHIEIGAAKTRPKPAHVTEGWGADPWKSPLRRSGAA